MAPLPVISHVYRVTWNFATYLGVTPRIVQHYQQPSGTEGDLAAAIWDRAPTNLFGCMHIGYEPPTIDILPLNGTTPSSTFPRPDTDEQLCNGSGDPMPAVAGIISFKTAIRGPRGRGRSYMGPAGEENFDGGVATGSWVGDTQDAWGSFLSDLVTDGVIFGVASYTHSDFHALEGFTVENIAGTQRRRQGQLRI